MFPRCWPRWVRKAALSWWRGSGPNRDTFRLRLLDWFRKSIARRQALLAAVTTAVLMAIGAFALRRHWTSDLILTAAMIVIVSGGAWAVVHRTLGRPLNDLTESIRQ